MKFTDIIGHQQKKNYLKSLVESKSVNHAYLFSGPDRIGKSLVARALAEELIGSFTESHPDFMLVAPEKQNSAIRIDQIRELEGTLSLRPYQSDYQVVIIDQAERMNPPAQNSLLKTLEEPSGQVVIMLISSRPEELLPTIRSRCQEIKFSPLSVEELSAYLIRKHQLNIEQAKFLANLSEGSLGRAQSMIAEGFFDEKNQMIDDFQNQGSLPEDKDDLFITLQVLTSWYRDLLISRELKDSSLISNIDRWDELKAKTTQFSNNELTDSIDMLDWSYKALNSNANVRLVIEHIKTNLVRK